MTVVVLVPSPSPSLQGQWYRLEVDSMPQQADTDTAKMLFGHSQLNHPRDPVLSFP